MVSSAGFRGFAAGASRSCLYAFPFKLAFIKRGLVSSLDKIAV